MAQGQRNRSSNKRSRDSKPPTGTNAHAPKSRVPFVALIVGIVALTAGGIYYRMQSAPKPIVLANLTDIPKSEGYLLGNPDAPVTIIEFADFECEQCANFSAITEPDIRKRLIETGLVNLRFFDFPLTEMHPNSLFASLAASCAADQNKFWPMHDELLANQAAWQGHTQKKPNPLPEFEQYARKSGVDLDQYKACMTSRENVPRIQAHYQAGLDRQVPATPSFIIGGVLYPGNQPYDRIKQLVDLELAKQADRLDSAPATIKK